MLNTYSTHRTYSPEFKLLVILGLAPHEMISPISRRSIYNFKKYDFSKVYGFSYSKNDFDIAKSVIKSPSLLKLNKTILKSAKTILYIKNTIINIYSSALSDFTSLLNSDKVKQKIIFAINKTKNILTCSPFFVPFYEGKTQALFPINS